MTVRMAPKPAERIFVSEVASALGGGCAYRLLMNSPPNIYNPGQLMPQHNKTILGIIFHEMLDEVSKGKLNQENLQELLTERSKERFQTLNNNGVMALEPNFNSAESINDFRRTAGRLELERDRLNANLERTKSQRGSLRRMGREIFVKGLSERVSGLIDEVSKEGEGAVITDDKTGLILSKDGSVKEDYRRQVLLYAALWSKQFDERVALVRLRSKSGTVVWKQEVTEDEIESIFSDVKNLLHRMDQADVNPLSLAKPTHHNCRFCEQRVICKPHLELVNIEEQGEPCIFRGRLEKVFQLPGSKLKLTLTINDRKVQTTVNSKWFFLEKNEPLPVEVYLHAFYPDTRNKGKYHARLYSHMIVKFCDTLYD